MQRTSGVLIAEEYGVATKIVYVEPEQTVVEGFVAFVDKLIAGQSVTDMNLLPATSQTNLLTSATPVKNGNCVSRINISTQPCMQMQRLNEDDLKAARASE